LENKIIEHCFLYLTVIEALLTHYSTQSSYATQNISTVHTHRARQRQRAKHKS